MSTHSGDGSESPPPPPPPPPANQDGTVVSVNGAAGDQPSVPPQLPSDNPVASSTADQMEVDDSLSPPVVGASGFVQTNVPPLLSGPSRLDSTVDILQRIVNKEIAKLDAGEISELSAQTMELMDRLVSLQSPAAALQQDSVPSLARSFAEVLSSKPKRVVLTSQDVKQVPRLTGSADVDVISCLQQYRLVCSFRVKANAASSVTDAELVKLSDEVAFEHVSLICDGMVLTLYQHVMEGRINWTQPSVDVETTDAPGSHPAPKNWSELKTALLDCLMPSNSVEESALRLAEFKMDPSETGASYALRFQNECARFEASVQRFSPGRSPYAALAVVLFRNGFVPGIKILAQQEKHPKTMNEAVAQLRRLEAANLSGTQTRRVSAHVSANSFTHVPNRTAIAQQYSAVSLRAASGSAGSSSGNSSSGKAGARPKTNKPHKAKSKGGTDSRPKCTHPTCIKKLGHTVEQCFVRRNEEKAALKARLHELERHSKRPKKGSSGKQPRKATVSAVTAAGDDDEDDE